MPRPRPPTTSAARRSRAATRCSAVTRPDVITALHGAFLEVGVDVVETATLRRLRLVLAEYGIAEQAHELNVAAARLAREVADDYAADGRLASSPARSGPAPSSPTPRPRSRFAELRDAYEVQAHGLLEGGVDLFLIETCIRPARR